MEKLEELLPGIEDFLINILEKEKLSPHAEKKRKLFLERLEILRLPPSLPPRPDGLPRFTNGSSTPPSVTDDDDPIARLREESRQNTNNSLSGSNQEAEDYIGDEYDCVDVEHYPGSYLAKARKERAKLSSIASTSEGNNDADIDGELYEIPITDNQTDTQDWSDADSGTSYETYDEEDTGDAVYENQNFAAPRDNIPLPSQTDSDGESQIYDEVDERPPLKPAKRHSLSFYRERVRTKVRRKRKSETALENLLNVTHKGELYQKGLFSPVKRYCVISDNKLIGYKNEKDTKPIVNFPLLGYDVLYFEKEGKFSHVIRISHPGCETHWFGAETRENADVWMKHLKDAAFAVGPATVERTASNSSSNSNQLILPTSAAESGVSGQVSSEGGSGDGSVGGVRSPSPLPPGENGSNIDAETQRKSSSLDKKKKQSGGVFGGLFNTFGKKKGDKVKRLLEQGSEDMETCPTDPDTKVSGYLNIMSVMASNKKWNRRYCLVKKTCFHCYKEPKDPVAEFTLPLTGLNIEMAAIETKRDLAIKLMQDDQDKVYIEAENSMDHGRWLNVLIKVTGCADQGDMYENTVDGEVAADDSEDIYDEVYSHRSSVRRGTSSSAGSSFSSQSASTLSSSIPSSRDCSGDSEFTDTRPPPLPPTGPPIHRLSPRGKSIKSQGQGSPKMGEKGSTSGTGDLGDEYDDVFSGSVASSSLSSVNVEDVVDSVFRIAKTKVDEDKPIPERDSGWRVARVDKPGKENKDTFTASRVVEVKVTAEKPEVVKCHLGPTIAEDEELFKCTQNPLLKELRKEKENKDFTPTDRVKLDSQIEELEREYEKHKRERAELRGKTLSARGYEKTKLEKNLLKVEENIDETDKELTKLRLFAKEKDAANFRRNSGQTSSFGRGTKSTTSNSPSQSPLRSPRINPTISPVSSKLTALSSSGEASRLRSISPASPKSGLTSPRSWQNKDNKTTASSTPTTRATLLATASLSSQSYTSKSSITKTVSSTTTKWSSSSGNGKAITSSSASSLSSTRTTTARNGGQTATSTSRTSARIRNNKMVKESSTSSASPASTTRSPAETRISNGRVGNKGDANANQSNGSTRSSNRPIKTVQGKVKLWESMVDGSNC